MRTLLLSLVLTVSLRAEMIDRVAVAIGHQAITESEIDEELRVTALLNHAPVLRDQHARRDAADRLIQQFLIRREMEISRYPLPTPAEISAYVGRVEHELGGASRLQNSLEAYNLDPATLTRHLSEQLATLRFIETRFRPEFSVSDADVKAYAERQSSAGDAESIRKQLSEKRIDEALAIWLEEARKQFNIVYLDQALQ